MKKEVVYVKAIRDFGFESQTSMIQEECAELISAINQLRRGRVQEDAVMEEIADVEIMIEQARLLFPSTKIDEIKNKKIARLEKILFSIER